MPGICYSPPPPDTHTLQRKDLVCKAFGAGSDRSCSNLDVTRVLSLFSFEVFITGNLQDGGVIQEAHAFNNPMTVKLAQRSSLLAGKQFTFQSVLSFDFCLMFFRSPFDVTYHSCCIRLMR
jgi:hypothetical protein